jgi:crotonobetainyl-CoA:carnitine CoA-transferase CaiB-like acyl-CoA transferase
METAKLLADLGATGVPVVVPANDTNHPFMDDPENLRIGRVGEFVHPRLGRVREVALPVRVDGTAMPPHRRAPELGEHTDSILSWAGYSAEDIVKLRKRGAVR